MCLVVAQIGHFHHVSSTEFPLNRCVPFVDQRVTEVLGDAPEVNRRVQAEDVHREPAGNTRIGVKKWIRFKCGDTWRASQCRRLVERYALATVRVAALVFFTTVEYAVTGPNHGLRNCLIREPNPRRNARLVPRDQILAHFATRDFDVTEVGSEVGREFRVLVFALRDK